MIHSKPLAAWSSLEAVSEREVTSGTQLLFLTFRALTQRPQILKRVDAGVVAIAPSYLIGVMPHRLKLDRLERHEFAGLENAEGIGRLQMLLAAAGTRAVVTKVLPRVDATMAVVPFDDQALVAFFFQG